MFRREVHSMNTSQFKRPVILVDIDDTLNQFADTFWNLHNRLYGEQINPSSVNQWDLGLFSNRGAEVYQLFKYPGLFRNIPVKPYGKEFIDSMQRLGEVYFVTDAPSGTAYGETTTFHQIDENLECFHSNPTDDKKAWVKENFPSVPKENIVFCSCKWMLEGDVLIDDKPDTFLEFQRRGKACILMDMPYNRHIQTEWRAKDLKEAETMVHRLLGRELAEAL